jgi:hypothetical protein
VSNTLFCVSESEEESIPKKPVTPVNGKAAAKPPAEYVNNTDQTKKYKTTWTKLNLFF